MIQGTGSHVGKSVIVAGLCRIFAQKGYRVAPFKSQNMALNSYVTRDGGEIGRAQAVQAQAVGIEPSVDMNPILLKPGGDSVAQVIVLGRPIGNMTAIDYHHFKGSLLDVAKTSLDHLRKDYDVVVIEGAGSPAEINLQDQDIANMKIAELAESPVILVGDIDKGGVFASFVGTLELLERRDRERIAGFIINKFRGDARLLDPALKFLEERTSQPVIGVVPYFENIFLEEEDGVSLERAPANSSKGNAGDVEIAVIKVPHISNFTDFDALAREERVALRYIFPSTELNHPDLVILPGSKSTISDLRYLWTTGLANKIIALAKEEVPIVGICGGYQMLGRVILDPCGAESKQTEMKGLGLLDLVTKFEKDKTICQVEAEVVAERGILSRCRGMKVHGYEIHVGKPQPKLEPEVDNKEAFLILKRGECPVVVKDGMIRQDGLIFGTYIHGLFENDAFRKGFLDALGEQKGLPPVKERLKTSHFREEQFNKLAELLRRNLNLDLIENILET
jgi:adenosylcobyric acid synthase